MNDAKPGPNEIKTNVARAYGPNAVGLQRYAAAIMLSFIKEGPEPASATSFMDVFMDEACAVHLHAELGERLKELKRSTP